jgi:hypothetical protein
MITADDKPTAWEGEGDNWFRRAAVWPNVLLHVRRGRYKGEEDVIRWDASFGLPGITLDEVDGTAPDPEAAKRAADDAAVLIVAATIARMVEALGRAPGEPTESAEDMADRMGWPRNMRGGAYAAVCERDAAWRTALTAVTCAAAAAIGAKEQR